MLTKTEALELVSSKLSKMSSLDDPFAINDSSTIERDFGWVLFYNSKKFLESGEFQYKLAGNGPVIVNKRSGEVEFCASHKPVDECIKEYESKLNGDKEQAINLFCQWEV